MAQRRLAEIAQRFGLELKGDGEVEIVGVCTLEPGRAGCISFLSNPRLRAALATTQAAAVIVAPPDAARLATPGLVARDPYLAYARVATLFDPWRAFAPGVHASAVVAAGAVVAADAHVAAHAVVESGAEIGAGCYVGPASIVGSGARLGAGTRLEARVFVRAGVQIGQRCRVEPGAVIGSRGFGNAMSPQGWVEVPQLGSVVIGDDVEIGANTTIDRGAIEDTVIESGVRLDNLIQIAHNCRIGAHTAIAACTGIAGSTRVGRRCMIGGAVAMNGHIEIGDDVVILGRAMVTHSLLEKGIYGSGLPAGPAREWRRTIARIRRLERLEQRTKTIEQRLGIEAQEDREHEPDSSD